MVMRTVARAPIKAILRWLDQNISPIELGEEFLDERGGMGVQKPDNEEDLLAYGRGWKMDFNEDSDGWGITIDCEKAMSLFLLRWS